MHSRQQRGSLQFSSSQIPLFCNIFKIGPYHLVLLVNQGFWQLCLTNNFIPHLSLEFSFQYLWLLCLTLPHYHIFCRISQTFKTYFEYIYSVVDFQMSNFPIIFNLRQWLLSDQWLTWPHITQEVIYHCYYFKCFYDPICQQLHRRKTMTPIQRNVMFSSDPKVVL